MPYVVFKTSHHFVQSEIEQKEFSRAVIDEFARDAVRRPFVPHRLFRNGHAQTLVGHFWMRRRELAREHPHDEARLFRVADEVQMLAHCSWQTERQACPTLVLLHGLEGSSQSVYMLGMRRKAIRAGFNVVRLNMRNCGGTEHLTETLYNSSMSDDLRAVLTELAREDGLTELYVVGVSMGGNITLKLAGELGASDNLPELKAVATISPALDLGACADKIREPSNFVYQFNFVRDLKRRVRRKQRLYPNIYDLAPLKRVRSIRDFDEHITARYGGFASADDYYHKSSAIRVVAHISRPTLILTAEDDPFVPFEPFLKPELLNNPHVFFLHTRHGGHVGFLADFVGTDADRFWAENRAVEFCRIAHDRLRAEPHSEGLRLRGAGITL